MQPCSRRNVVVAGVLLILLAAGAAGDALAQSGKPQYKPEVEAVARTIFLEMLSPY